MRREIIKKWKDEIIHTVWKMEKDLTIFIILMITNMAAHLFNLLQLFSKVFGEIWTSLFWNLLPDFNNYTLIPEGFLVTDNLFELSIFAIDFQ